MIIFARYNENKCNLIAFIMWYNNKGRSSEIFFVDEIVKISLIERISVNHVEVINTAPHINLLVL